MVASPNIQIALDCTRGKIIMTLKIGKFYLFCDPFPFKNLPYSP